MNGIVVVDDIRFLERNLSQVKKIIKETGFSAFPLSDPAYYFLRAHGVDCLSYHDFEVEGMYSGVYQLSNHWGRKWYINNQHDFTKIYDFSLGYLYEWVMIHFFVHMLRVYLSLKYFLEKFSPEKIVVISAENVELKDNISAWKHIDVTMLPELLNLCCKTLKLNSEIRVVKLVEQPKKLLKTKLKIAVKFIIIYANGILSKIAHLIDSALGKKKKILFFEGFRHFNGVMLASELKHFDVVHLQKTFGLSLFGELYWNGVRVESLNRDKKALDLSSINLDYSGIKNNLIDLLVFDGVSFVDPVWVRLEYLFKDFFPKVMLPDLLSTDASLKNIKPDCVVVENDNTYNEKMVVVVAKKQGIQTIVVQNGATWLDGACMNKDLSVHDFYPLIADRFFAYGQVNLDWYKGMNEDVGKIIVTGSPRFDVYYKVRKIKRNKKSVLIILNDFGFNEGVVTQDMPIGQICRHLCELARVAKLNPELSFVIRPHSSEHLWESILNQELTSVKNLKISNRPPLIEELLNTDLVIGYLSTALIEALVLRIPVISLDVDNICSAFALWEYGLSERVQSFDQLDSVIKKYMYNQHARNEAVRSIDNNLRLFNFNDDGMAIHRIAVELKDALIRQN
ncbi:MAG: hypothetical protein HZC15_04020 [Candidatus Omnitrophica bacterium]|nr:hypothetical protein [Candidatus Omnitrophota bacterium]